MVFVPIYQILLNAKEAPSYKVAAGAIVIGSFILAASASLIYEIAEGALQFVKKEKDWWAKQLS